MSNVTKCCIALYIALFALWASPSWGAITLHTQIDRKHISIEDELLVRVVVSGDFQRVSDPEIPALNDWEVSFRGRSQNVQIINGEMDASVTYTYALVAKREGTLRIGSFRVQHRNRMYETEPVSIKVSAAAPSTSEEGRDLFVVARVDKEQAYVNEQIIYTFLLYSARRVSNLNYTQPSFEGFWVEKLQEGEKQYHKIVNGRRYLVIEVSTAIFPTTSGTISVDAGRLRLVELTDRSSFSFFDRGVERVLRSRPLEVEVLPLPASGRPADFDGAVGEGLSISAKLDTRQVEEGEPVTLTVRVSGAGNVRTFSEPRLPELPQFKTYSAESQTKVRAFDHVNGTRTFETVLVPLEPGELQLPPVRLSYFDTKEAKYRTVETKPLELTSVRTARSAAKMAASKPLRKQDIQVLGQDIEHIRTDVQVSDTRKPLYRYRGFWALAPLPMLFVLGSLFVQRRRDHLAANVALARSSRARKMARKRLSAAERYMNAAQSEDFYAEISRALQQYIGDKLNTSASGLTHEALRTQLAGAGVSDDHRERVVQVLEQSDAARFAPGSAEPERMQQLLREVESLVVEIEGLWGRKSAVPGKKAARMAVILLGLGLQTLPVSWPPHLTASLPLGVALPGVAFSEEGDTPKLELQQGSSDFTSPQEWLRRGHKAYEAGNFGEAIAAYERAEELGVRNGPLYYDLGNAYFKDGQLGHSIAAYRRAQMLMPRDHLLQSNLEYALSQRTDKAVAPSWPFPFSLLRQLFRSFTLNEWLVVTLCFYVAACVMAVLMILRRRHAWPWRWSLYVLTAGLILTSATSALKIRSERGVQRGVIAVEKLNVKSGPGLDYVTEFTVHEGTEVQIEAERPDWWRITVGSNLRGWVPKQSLTRI